MKKLWYFAIPLMMLLMALFFAKECIDLRNERKKEMQDLRPKFHGYFLTQTLSQFSGHGKKEVLRMFGEPYTKRVFTFEEVKQMPADDPAKVLESILPPIKGEVRLEEWKYGQSSGDKVYPVHLWFLCSDPANPDPAERVVFSYSGWGMF